VIAGLIALPYGLAMASLMGLPPVIALMGRNPVLIGGTTSATVPFLALAAKQRGLAGAAQLSILAAVIMIGFAVTRVGRQITRVPEAVVTGFSCGIGAMMLISQLDLILGVEHASGAPIMQLFGVLRHVGQTHAVPLVPGVCVILIATLAARFSPHAPAPLSVGIPARSLAVVRCGGTTAIANLVHAAALLLMLWLGSGFISRIPIPALAGVTAWMGICLLDWSAWHRLRKMSRVDAAAFLVTAVSVLAVNAVLAVAFGCSLYLLRAAFGRSTSAVEEAG
jgi:MFS superfamily sulfate permease-like transporter